MIFKIDLPKAADWSAYDNYAENLRETKIAGITGCVPTGAPKVISGNAGLLTEMLPGGDILSVSDDRHELLLNGVSAGSLSSPLHAILPQGAGEALLFTADGVEWFADGQLQEGKPSQNSVALTITEDSESISAEVMPPVLTGSYTHSYGSLTDDDASAATGVVAEAIAQLDSQALAAGKWLQPVSIAWRMIDTEGRVVFISSPQRFGSPQATATISFSSDSSDEGIAISTPGSVDAIPFKIRIEIPASASTFWQNRIASIEVIAWSDLAKITSVTGAYTQVSSELTIFSVTPTFAELERDAVGPQLIARIDFPLVNGVDMVLSRVDDSPCEWADGAEDSPIIPSAVCAAGTITAYALADKPGTLAVASGNEPLIIRATRRICMSNILRITPPAGTAGGWNYGRHHLLAFTIDGIYAVSIDSALRTVSSSRLAPLGIERSDAVAVSPEALYVASISGSLLRLKGTRIESLKMPLTPKSVCRNVRTGELWVAPDMGCPWVLNDSGGVSLRTDVTVARFVEPAMAVDSFGRLLNLTEEEEGDTYVEWRRREICEVREQMRKALWVLDSQRASDLSLQILADSGGASQRLLELTANGPINAPIAASFRAPRRAFYTAKLRGTFTAPSRLLQVSITG